MLNLIPTQQRSVLHKEYSARRLVVILGLVLSALVISLVLLFPSYFLTRVKAKAASIELENSKRVLDAKLPSDEVMGELNSAIKHVADLRPLSTPISTYDLIKILESRPREIKITNIAYTTTPDNRPTIRVSGKAPNRESLTRFARVLEGRVEFEKVDLPVSNFVQEKDIEFSMEITIK